MTLTLENAITADHLAQLLAVSASDAERALRASGAAVDLSYEPLTQLERDAALLRAVRAITVDELRQAGSGNQARWEAGWQENLTAIQKNGFQVANLQPRYFHYNMLRYQGDYIRVESQSFEQDFYTVARRLIFGKYLAGASRVVEFGCGTGTSILLMLEMFPDLQAVGCDWSRPSQEILAVIRQQTGRDVRGIHFDMFHPQNAEPIAPARSTAVVTMHALEQIGANIEPMLTYIQNLQPEICVHLEPIVELYDPNHLFDFVAQQYHLKRNYLNGFLPRLQELERQGKVELVEVRRLGFGSFFQEGYSLVVWRPTDYGKST